MTHNDAYRKAEAMIAEARRTGATKLVFTPWGPGSKVQKLTELPESLGQLTQLQTLKLSNNELVTLPESLGQLTRLQTLDLSGNQLSVLPESLGQLTQLQSLDLNGNQLTALPESLGQLRRLQTLNLSRNQLTALPESLRQLTQLQTLTLFGNQLTALPESLGQLTQLQSLDLSSNQLTALPESLGQLTQLQTLGLSCNQLTALPESLSELTQLQTLDHSHNQLTALPEWLGQLTQLQELNLSNNQLTALPEWLGQLTQLQTLNLSNNQLTGLPESLGQLTSLRILYLFVNKLTTLPESLGLLAQLKVLQVEGNHITEFPRSITHLNALEALGLGQSGMGGNPVNLVPAELKHLTRLTALFLVGCDIHDLPDWFSKLENLEHLKLDDNPLEPELAAAYEQGLDAVKAYLRAKAEDQIVLNEAKLILIGEGEVGKSSLLGALRGDEWVANRPTTHGVEVAIRSVVLDVPGEPQGVSPRAMQESDAAHGPAADASRLTSPNQIMFNGWDFGGQAIYRCTHQLFFTAPAIYLAVWNPRRGPDVCKVEEWLRMVKQRAYDETRPDERPRVLVVATHGGPKERSAHIDEDLLRDEFGDLIIDFFHVDSKTGFGIDELKAAIARTAAAIPSVGRTVPTSWKNVLDALRKRSERDPYISYKKFLALCGRQKVKHDQAALYAVILNELGHLIHYRGDAELQNTVILKPEWLSKAISYVLEDSETKENNGLVRHNRLSGIWNDPDRPERERYPDELHPVFLKLMERFDLSYQVVMPQADAPSTSLVAQLVPGGRPEGWEQDWPDAPKNGDASKTQICRIVDAETGRTSEVEGLLYRLIVRLHRYSLGRRNYFDSRHWKTGLILDDGPNGRAFIEEISGDIYVHVRAAYPDRFLHLLCEEVNWLISDFWKGLDCLFAVPCGAPCKGLLELQEMFDNLEEDIDKVRCPVCRKYHLINDRLATATPKPSFSEALAELKQGQHEIKRGQEEGFASVSSDLRRLISQADEQYAALMTVLTDVAKDGPRLFSFHPVKLGFLDKPTWIAEKFRLTLWCEHARLPVHVLNGDGKSGVYEIELTREWLTKSAPLLKILSGTLSLALPIASSGIKLATPDFKAIENELDFGKACAQTLGKSSEMLGDWITGSGDTELESTRVIMAQGSMLRELHGLLKNKDPNGRFGGLERVQNKRREFLWVHPQFVSEY